MTAPTIEPAADNPRLPPPYYQAPREHPPYEPSLPRPSWFTRNPGVTVSLIIALATGMTYVVEGVWDLFTSAERAERQRAIEDGDRAQAELTAKATAKLRTAIKGNGQAISANGAAIHTLANHQLENARYIRRLLWGISPDRGAQLEMPDALRDAEKELRAVK